MAKPEAAKSHPDIAESDLFSFEELKAFYDTLKAEKDKILAKAKAAVERRHSKSR